MIWRAFLLSIALLFTTFFEASFISAWQAPFALVPLSFVVGVLLYHFLSPMLGAAWLAGGGILLDLFSPFSHTHFFAFALAALLGLLLARKVFANRSLYATIGLGACMEGCSLLVAITWIVSQKNTHGHAVLLTDLSAYFWSHMFVFVITLCVGFAVGRRGAKVTRRLFLVRS